jgi:hypothetical protein
VLNICTLPLKVVSLVYKKQTNKQLKTNKMKTYEMTISEIFETIKKGEANVEEIAVCGKLFNDGSDLYFIRIDGENITGMKKCKTGYEIDKVVSGSNTPDSEIMKLAERIKASADEAKRLSETEMTEDKFSSFFSK